MTYGLIAICPYVIRLGLWAINARTGFRFVETPRSEVDLLLLSDANGNMTTGTLANHWTWDALKRFDSLEPRCVMENTFEVARLGESLSRSHQDAEKTSCPARWRRPLTCVQQFPSCLMYCWIQTHRSRARHRHGFERALDHCSGVV